jgi:porin
MVLRNRHVVSLAGLAILVGLPRWALSAQRPDIDSVPGRAVTPLLIYDGELISNVAGGLQRGTTYEGVAQAQFTFNFRRIFGWRGASGFFFIAGLHGGQPEPLVGDIQGVSDLEGQPMLRVQELWIQQNAIGNRVSLLAGRYDVNSEFYLSRSGELFLNSSFGMGAEFGLSGFDGPSSFPNTALGARLATKPTPNSIWRFAVVDAVPFDRPNGGIHPFATEDGVLLVSEVGLLSREDTTNGPRRRRFLIGRGHTRLYTAKVAIGGWYYTARFPDLSDTLANGQPVLRRGSRGAYLIVDETVLSGRNNPRALSVFFQAGLGDRRVNQIGSYTGGGLTFQAPFLSRPKDEIGLGVAAAHVGAHWVRSPESLGLADGETAIELTYAAQLSESFALQPDVQYIKNPGATRAVKNALVLGLRAEVTW